MTEKNVVTTTRQKEPFVARVVSYFVARNSLGNTDKYLRAVPKQQLQVSKQVKGELVHHEAFHTTGAEEGALLSGNPGHDEDCAPNPRRA